MKLRAILLWTAATLLLCGAVWLVPLNQDEGWYLLAARRVWQGLIPYKDFTFTQGPVLPFVYAPATPLVRAFGLLGGRLLQVLFSLATLAVLRRNLDERDFPLLLALFCIPFQMQFLLTIKTYALAALFLSLGAHFWLKQTNRSLALSAFFFALAAGTRISLGFFFLPLFLSLLGRPRERPRGSLAVFTLTGLATLSALFAPFLFWNADSFFFQTIGFHQARDIGIALLFRAGSLLRWIQAWLPALLMCAALRRPRFQCVDRALFIGVLGTGLMHLFTPFPYDEYQTPLYPVLLLWLFRQPDMEKLRPHAPRIILAVLLFSISSPRLHSWIPASHDRLWHSISPETELQQLRRVGRDLKNRLPAGAILFTPDSYLAIESGLEVPRGLEMGPFSFSPDGTRAELLSLEQITDRLARSDAVAFSQYLFVRSPEVQPMSHEDAAELRRLIAEQFNLVSMEEAFGQGGTTLQIGLRRTE